MPGRSPFISLKVVITGSVAALLVTALFLAGALEDLELITLDVRLAGLSRPGSAPVSFVLIDQNSLKNLGQWPFPRGVYARLIDELDRSGAAGVLLDVDLSSSSPQPEEDRKLERSVRSSGKVVLALQWEEKVTRDGVVVRNISRPRGELAAGALGLGGITFQVDRDGAIRRMPRDLAFGRERYQPLGVVGARLLDPDAGRRIPADAHINFPYRYLSTVPVVSLHKVLEGDYPSGSFQHRVVLVGASSPDLHDQWITPVGIVPGVFIQAAVLDTALSRSWHQRQGPWSTAVSVLALSLIAAGFMARTGWRGGLLWLAVILTGVIALSVPAARQGMQMQVVPLLLAAALQYPLQLGIRISGVERKLVHERQRAEAILELAELNRAEDAGQDVPTVPLVLLKQILGFDRIILYIAEEKRVPPWKPQVVLDERTAPMRWHPDKVSRTLAAGEVVIDRNASLAVYVPLMTSRKTMGVLFAEGPADLALEKEDVRLLLAHATQAAYLLEFRDLEGKVRSLYTNSLKAFIRALGAKDQYTGAHAELSQEYVDLFGRACGLTVEQIQSLHIGALLHDIGKIGIPDAILTKSGELTEEEYAVMKRHPMVGHDIIRDLPFPQDVRDIILCHHENYDGSGYPRGLAGDQIPMVARIFSILDTFEALVGKRPYRTSVAEKRAIEVMREASGTQFDPDLLGVFMACLSFRQTVAPRNPGSGP